MATETLEQLQETAQPRRSSMLSMGGLVAFGLVIALLVIVGIGLQRASQGPLVIGDEVPNIKIETFDGQIINTTEHAGKILVINFWASWCKPCEQEAADLEEAWRYYQESGEVLFIGVDYVDTEPQALAYLERFDITYPNGPDKASRISDVFRTTGVPETYIIDKEGRLANFLLGPYIGGVSQIKAMIDPLLAP